MMSMGGEAPVSVSVFGVAISCVCVRTRVCMFLGVWEMAAVWFCGNAA